MGDSVNRYISSASGTWTRSDCTIHAIRNYLNKDAPEYGDFFTYLRKNHRISDFLYVLTECNQRENTGLVAVLAEPWFWTHLRLKNIQVYHIFVITGNHIYNITCIDNSSRYILIDSVYDRCEIIDMHAFIDAMRSADRAIFMVESRYKHLAINMCGDGGDTQ
jgi:hypothetical protein